MSGVKNHPVLFKIITTFRQSRRNTFAAACFAFADPLHPTTSLANPFAEFLLLTSKKSISMYQQRGIIPNLQPLLSPHLREPFANLSPGYHESLDDMLCTENLFANPFATKSIHQKIRAFLQTFRQAFPNCSFPFAQIHNLKSYLNSFIEVYDVAHIIPTFHISLPHQVLKPKISGRTHLTHSPQTHSLEEVLFRNICPPPAPAPPTGATPSGSPSRRLWICEISCRAPSAM